MRRATYTLAIIAACLFAGTPAADARQPMQAPPSSDTLLHDMTVAADEWWTLQGSPPPCPFAVEITWGTVGVYSEWAYYDSCVVMLSPHWWATQYAFVTGRRSLRTRRRTAAYDLALIMHARGHNLGYRHIPGTVMQENTPVVPGWAFAWAYRTIR